MTPNRLKRNSKAPNRFSSDSSQIETSNDPTRSDTYTIESTSVKTNNTSSTNRTIKLKPLTREPLKVKLPKLRRLQSESARQGDILHKDSSEIKIHKIKLPTLLSKKSKNIKTEGGSKGKTKTASKETQDLTITTPQDGSQSSHNSGTNSSKQSTTTDAATNGQPTASPQYTTGDSPSSKMLDVSTTSKSSNEEKSSNANSSFSSDEQDDVSSRMEIVVSQQDSSNGSGIRCPCGVDDDLGVMVECESCSTWQHGHCINVGTEEEAYEGYICAYCSLPQDKVRESLRELTVGDRFQSRFKLLESLKGQNDTRNQGQQYVCNETVENNAQLTVEELSQAIGDLSRVMSSLKVKWRILTSPSYEMELRIWQNSYWTDEKSGTNSDKNNFYFIDCCKSNLRSNIRNIVTKLEERCRLIDYAILLLRLRGERKPNDGEVEAEDPKLRQARRALEVVVSGMSDFKNKLKSITD